MLYQSNSANELFMNAHTVVFTNGQVYYMKMAAKVAVYSYSRLDH